MQLDVYRRLIWTDEVRALLRSANFRGNALTEEEALSQLRWPVPDTADLCYCDAVALWKLADLSNQKIPTGPLFFTVCRDPEGNIRSLLTVATDRGDIVLDRLRPDLVTYAEAKEDGTQMLYRTAVTDSIDELCRIITSYRS